jgi:hypothetical protein
MRTTQLNGLAVVMLLAAGCLFAACQAQPIEATGKNTAPLGDGLCKTHDELPPPTINAPNNGACPAIGSDCRNAMPLSLCTEGERRMVLTCDAATKTWQVMFKECAGDGGVTVADGGSTNVDAGAPPPNAPPQPCKPRDEVPPPTANAGVCPAEGTACSSPFALCEDKDGHRMFLNCDNTKHTWYIVLQECI